MPLFRRREKEDSTRPSRGTLDELEVLFRRLRALPLAAPVLLLVGFGVGNVTNKALAATKSTTAPVIMEAEAPRVHLEALSARMRSLRDAGDRTFDYVTLYREQVEPVETVLRRRGVPERYVRQISWPLVENSYAKGIDPATVVAVMMMESGGKPTARSSVGARGLMQVMPFWAGRWRGCGSDLYNIEENICNGTSILAWYMRSHPNEHQALLGYNGCVRGTNTPNCFTYPDKVLRLREQIKREIQREQAQIRTSTGSD